MMWRLYYEDGNTFSDSDGSPGDSPQAGVVAVGQTCGGDKFNDMLVNGPFFLWREDWGCWIESDYAGLLDQCSMRPCLLRVGRWMAKADFLKLCKRVREEIDAAKT